MRRHKKTRTVAGLFFQIYKRSKVDLNKLISIKIKNFGFASLIRNKTEPLDAVDVVCNMFLNLKTVVEMGFFGLLTGEKDASECEHGV